MRVILRSNAIEEAAIDFEQSVLANSFYKADDPEGSLNLIYTCSALLKDRAQVWITQALACGTVSSADLLDDDEWGTDL
jgi:hypothetical protein